MKHKDWLERTVEMAVDNVKKGGGPFAAIVVKDGTVIGSGTNSVQSACDPSAHAELIAIKEACAHLQSTNLSDCILYASGEPCPMCLGAAYWTAIGEIQYACSKQDAWEAVRFENPLETFFSDQQLPPVQRKVPFIQNKTSNALAPFEEWEQQTK